MGRPMGPGQATARRMLLAAALAFAAPVSGYVDLHIHLAAHLTVPVYGAGPERPAPADLTNEHGLRAQIFLDQLEAPGPAVLVSLAYANPFTTVFESKASMEARIERQLVFVEGFCARHADRFGLARTPEEARAIVASGRKAIVHGIEGATLLLDGPEDAQRWADRGVAVITPIHLADNEFGGAWCQSGSLAWLNLPGCRRERADPAAHGLTPAGRAAVEALVAAGVVVDLAHMSHASFAEATAILRDRGAAPVYTHATSFAVSDDPTAMRDDELLTVEALGGLVGITANPDHLRPRPEIVRPSGDCPGSVDDLKRHWDHMVGLLGGGPLGWGSDFQGGIDHLRPEFGPRGCASAPVGVERGFAVEGLAHADLVDPMFAALAEAGADRAPLDASAERFLSLWARDRAIAGR